MAFDEAIKEVRMEAMNLSPRHGRMAKSKFTQRSSTKVNKNNTNSNQIYHPHLVPANSRTYPKRLSAIVGRAPQQASQANLLEKHNGGQPSNTIMQDADNILQMYDKVLGKQQTSVKSPSSSLQRRKLKPERRAAAQLSPTNGESRLNYYKTKKDYLIVDDSPYKQQFQYKPLFDQAGNVMDKDFEALLH